MLWYWLEASSAMLRWMEYKEGGIDILLRSGKLNIMKWFKEFIAVNSRSLRFFLLFSKVESGFYGLMVSSAGRERQSPQIHAQSSDHQWSLLCTGSCRLFPGLWLLRHPPLAFMALACRLWSWSPTRAGFCLSTDLVSSSAFLPSVTQELLGRLQATPSHGG